jgi:hypothetical protein
MGAGGGGAAAPAIRCAAGDAPLSDVKSEHEELVVFHCQNAQPCETHAFAAAQHDATSVTFARDVAFAYALPTTA